MLLTNIISNLVVAKQHFSTVPDEVRHHSVDTRAYGIVVVVCLVDVSGREVFYRGNPRDLVVEE